MAFLVASSPPVSSPVWSVAVRRGQPARDALRVRVCCHDDDDGSLRHGGAQVHASLRVLKSDSREEATESS